MQLVLQTVLLEQQLQRRVPGANHQQAHLLSLTPTSPHGRDSLQVGAMKADSGHAVEELARLTRRRDNLAALVDRLSVLDGLSAGAAALGLLLEVSILTTLGRRQSCADSRVLGGEQTSRSIRMHSMQHDSA